VAVVSLGVVNGKRLRRKVRAQSERDAIIARDRLTGAYRGGLEPTRQTLGRYLAEWLPSHSRRIRASTARSYEGHVRLHIVPLLGGIELARLQRRDVNRLIAALEGKGLSAGTIHLVVRTLSAALEAAVRDRIIAYNPATGADLPRIEREPVHALTDDEADAILEAVQGTWIERPVRVWLGSGLRRGEVLGLDQGDVGDGFVRVRVSKTSVRAVPVSGDAMLALQEALRLAPRNGPHEPVFFAPRKGHPRMRGDSVTHALRVLADTHPHALRHGVATLMVARGVHMRVVAAQLGHSNPSLTARVYAHVAPDLQRDAIDTIGRKTLRTLRG
jgi:integrase